MEKQARKAQDELEKRVKERTAELSAANRLLRQEIATRQRVEEELKESRERLRYLTAYLQRIRDEERTALSRELHDELGQVLTGIKMDVSWIGRRVPEGFGAVHDRVKSLLALIDSTIVVIQRISAELRPVSLDDFGLLEAMKLTASDFKKRTNIACEIISEVKDVEIKKEIVSGVFRIFQEALTNVARHAKARRVRVLLGREEDKLMMEIRDDGRGITKKEITDPKSIGLTGMRERAYALGGTLAITGIHEKGTFVNLNVPLR